MLLIDKLGGAMDNGSAVDFTMAQPHIICNITSIYRHNLSLF